MPYETTVRVMNLDNQFRFEKTAPKPTLMILTKDKMVFKGVRGQDNSFLNGKTRYEISKRNINEVKFNPLINSAIKVKFLDGRMGKTMFIQHMSRGALPYNINATNNEYRNIKKWLGGEKVASKKIPLWMNIVALIILILGAIIGGIIGFVVALVINAIIYAFFLRKKK